MTFKTSDKAQTLNTIVQDFVNPQLVYILASTTTFRLHRRTIPLTRTLRWSKLLIWTRERAQNENLEELFLKISMQMHTAFTIAQTGTKIKTALMASCLWFIDLL